MKQILTLLLISLPFLGKGQARDLELPKQIEIAKTSWSGNKVQVESYYSGNDFLLKVRLLKYRYINNNWKYLYMKKSTANELFEIIMDKIESNDEFALRIENDGMAIGKWSGKTKKKKIRHKH